LPLSGLCWSREGGHLYSGGGERVLCKWLPESGASPIFTPHLAAGILGITAASEHCALKLADNSVVLLDRQDRPAAELAGLSANSSGWPAGLAWDSRTGSLLLNGRVGHVQARIVS
jgi:NET1-associated nuclear protein 1 (U3 small nucleolar RNA-associated protein 17)